MFAQHRVEHAPGGRKELIVPFLPGLPLSIGSFKDRPQ